MRAACKASEQWQTLPFNTKSAKIAKGLVLLASFVRFVLENERLQRREAAVLRDR
jgi:hypothetical protein